MTYNSYRVVPKQFLYKKYQLPISIFLPNFLKNPVLSPLFSFRHHSGLYDKVCIGLVLSHLEAASIKQGIINQHYYQSVPVQISGSTRPSSP